MKPLVLLIVACLSAPALADVIYLTDGTKLEGDVKRTNDGYLVTEANGHVTLVPVAELKSIEIKKSTGTPQNADQSLASLRRAMANATDPRQVVQRYKEFIAQNAGTPAARSAQEDLTQWQDRLDKGLVKAGDQWITKEQLAVNEAKATEAADRIRPMIAAGKLNEAMAALDKALASAPENPALLYLKGVVFYRQNKLVPARKAFEGAEAQLPDHGPTHNNLAVILWQTHAQMPALLQYDKAMLAEPNNRQILDNVTEALHALPPEHQHSDLTKKVVQHYNDQEAALEGQMAEQGQYRWGSQWLNEKEFNKIKAATDQVQQKIDGYKKDATDIQARILRIDRDITEDTNVCNAIQQESMQIDGSGRVVQFPLPQRYWDLRRDIQSLQSERAFKVRELQQLPALVADLEKTKPVGKYLGAQKIFDEKRMPGASADEPATSPAASSQPAAPQPRPSVTAPAPSTAPAVPSPPSGGRDF